MDPNVAVGEYRRHVDAIASRYGLPTEAFYTAKLQARANKKLMQAKDEASKRILDAILKYNLRLEEGRGSALPLPEKYFEDKQ